MGAGDVEFELKDAQSVGQLRPAESEDYNCCYIVYAHANLRNCRLRGYLDSYIYAENLSHTLHRDVQICRTLGNEQLG